MSYVLFLDDIRHPHGMDGWTADASVVHKPAEGGAFCVPTFRSGRASLHHGATSEDACEWVIARNHDDFARALSNRGIPAAVYLDHDLCDEKTGYDCATLLVQKIRDELPDGAAVEIVLHSMNPVGRKNMAAAFLELNNPEI